MSTLSSPVSFTAHKKRSVRSTMTHVMVALIPGTLLYAILIDAHIFSNLIIACTLSVVCESLCLAIRKRPIYGSLSDGSILLATWLFVLCIPQSLPIWQLSIGVIVLVVLGKHVFGGLGQNPFNPAMVAYAFLLISFPVSMTSWNVSLAPLISTTTDQPYQTNVASWDALSGATTLDRIRQIKRTDPSVRTDSKIQITQGVQKHLLHSPWFWLALAWLAGGIYLLKTRIISWHIPLSVIATVSLTYFFFNVFSLHIFLSPFSALISGAILLGAFFIATDPVSAATSRMGQLFYGCGIGVFTVVIREFSVYPEGFAFAVLLMNMCVPMIDHIFIRKHDNPDRPSAS